MKKIDLSKLDVRTLRAIIKSDNLKDFLKYVKKNKLELSEEEASEIYNILNTDIVELNEEQLAMVAGGFATQAVDHTPRS